MATTDSTLIVTLPRWRMRVVRAHSCLLRVAVRFGMPVERALERIESAALWAVRGAKVR